MYKKNDHLSIGDHFQHLSPVYKDPPNTGICNECIGVDCSGGFDHGCDRAGDCDVLLRTRSSPVPTPLLSVSEMSANMLILSPCKKFKHIAHFGHHQLLKIDL